MRKKLLITLLVLLFSIFASAGTPPKMEKDGTNATNKPSMAAGARSSVDTQQYMMSCDTTTGVCILEVITMPGSTTQVCDALGNCAEVEPMNATQDVADETLLVSAGLYAYPVGGGITTTRLNSGTGPNAGGLLVAPPTDARFMVSADAAANTIAHPIFVQVSQDGTTAVGAANPLPISADMAANTIAHPMFMQISQDGTTAVGAANPLPISADMAANTIAHPIFTQISQDGTTAVGAANPIPVSATMAANTLANPMFQQLSNGATAFLDSTASPGYVRVQDQDSTEVQDVLAASADGLALTLNPAFVFSVTGAYNGATITMARINGANELMVYNNNVPNAFDLVNAWLRNAKFYSAPYDPAEEVNAIDATPTDEVGDEVFESDYMLTTPNWCMCIKNEGGGTGDPLQTVYFMASSTGNTGEWEQLGGGTCNGLAAAGGACCHCDNSARAYLKIEAICAVGDDTTAAGWIQGNQN